MLKPVAAVELKPETDTHLPDALAGTPGTSEWRVLGEQFGLSQFGVNLETLRPGGQSSLKHWHTENDEFVYVLEGALVLATSLGEYPIVQGMCIGFKAGVANAHHLLNRSTKPATFLVIGTRNADDNVLYPEDDLQWLAAEDGVKMAARKDGSFYE
jgi:uncharacterized cupin superfamily protein